MKTLFGENTHIQKLLSSLELIILNANNSCNMKCSYCYEEHLPFNTAPSQELIDLTTKFLSSCKNNPPLLIHGGEPLINDIEWFNALSASLTKESCQTKLLLQTNASLLEEIKLKWIADNNVHLGISCDGPPHINNLTRGNSDLIEKAFQNLKSINLSFGIITVINKLNYNYIEDILDYFESQGTESIKLNRIFASKNRALDISDQEYNNTLARAWHWVYSRHHVLKIYDICALEKSLLGIEKKSEICSTTPCGAGTKVISIDSDGNLYPCNRLINHKEFKLGTLSSFDKNLFEGFLEYKQKWYKKYQGSCLAMSCINYSNIFQRVKATEIPAPVSEKNMHYALSSNNNLYGDYGRSWDDYSDSRW